MRVKGDSVSPLKRRPLLAVESVGQYAYAHVEGVGESPDRLQSWGVVSALDVGDGAVRDLGLVGEVLDAPASVAPQFGDGDAKGLVVRSRRVTSHSSNAGRKATSCPGNTLPIM